MLVEARVCDVCRRLGEPVTRYTITADDGRRRETDRCAEHAEAFEAVLGEMMPKSPETAEGPPERAATAKKTAKKPGGRPRRRTQVTTVDEINKAKASGKS